MTAPPEAEPQHLFTVVVAGPGKIRWGVVVRAADEAAAAGNVESRGHAVLSVRAGLARPPHERFPRSTCIRCGYSLVDLPAGAASEIMCPECGVINVPDATPERVVRQRIRTRRMRWWLWGALAMFLLLVWLSPLLLRLF